MRASWVWAFTAMLGCSGASFETAPSTEDASVDSTSDSAAADSSAEDSTAGDTSESDSTLADSGADTGSHADAKPDVVITPDVISSETDGTPCHPFWCGCGVCEAKDIACTKSEMGCPLGCAMAPCPAAEMASTCSTVGDRCVRNGIAGDIACYHTGDCPPGNCCKTTPPSRGVCVMAPDSGCAP
jgi:hypothetical protein